MTAWQNEERDLNMKIARTLLAAGAMAGAAMALAGCIGTVDGSGPARIAAAPAGGVEGAWIDSGGTGLSTFAGGVFQTTATDTGQRLADGTYRMRDARTVEINGTSLIRQAPISFNCLMIDNRQLNCTSSGGQQFTLTRRA